MAEIDTESLGLYVPVLDPRNEEQLAQQGQLVAFNRSGGTLNDFSDHSPLAVLIQGQAFAGAELLYYVNQLPLALIVKFLEVAGTVRSLGARATATITFSLTAPLGSPLLIPAGFEVTNRAGDRRFTLIANLVIPAGQLSGNGVVQAVETGEGYNLPAYTINQFTTPLAFLATVVNVQPSQGGANAETLEEAIARGLVALRRRNLVTADDYETAAVEALGSGARAKAIGLLAADRTSYQLGAVHLFCLDSAGNPINQAQVNSLQVTLSPRIQIGTSLYVSPMSVLNVNAVLVAELAAGEDPESVADEMWSAFDAYLNRAIAGESVLVRELEHELRFAGGLQAIEHLELNGVNGNVPMATPFTIPRAFSMDLRLTGDGGSIFEVLRGEGEPEDFDP